jgi:hypothetical protein
MSLVNEDRWDKELSAVIKQLQAQEKNNEGNQQ